MEVYLNGLQRPLYFIFLVIKICTYSLKYTKCNIAKTPEEKSPIRSLKKSRKK